MYDVCIVEKPCVPHAINSHSFHNKKAGHFSLYFGDTSKKGIILQTRKGCSKKLEKQQHDNMQMAKAKPLKISAMPYSMLNVCFAGTGIHCKGRTSASPCAAPSHYPPNISVRSH